MRRRRPAAAGAEGYLPLACDGRVTATPKLKSGQNVPSRIHGTEVRWELREGADVVTLGEDPRFPDPFNRVLHTKGRVARFTLCATVLGVEGCFHGDDDPVDERGGTARQASRLIT